MTDKPKRVATIGHVHPSGLNAPALVKFAQSGGQLIGALEGIPFEGFEARYVRFSDGQILDANMKPLPDNGTKFTVLGYDEAAKISPEALAAVMARHRIDWVEFTPEPKETTTEDETAPPPVAVPTDPAGTPPRALSNNMAHRHFHPSYMRVGVRIDGVERNDLKWFDADAGQAITTGGTMISSEAIEPFWRYAESRQMRRARERWEKAHPGWTAKRTASQS